MRVHVSVSISGKSERATRSCSEHRRHFSECIIPEKYTFAANVGKNKRMPAVNVQVLLTELCPILALRSKGVGLAQMMRERCSYFIKTVWALFSTLYGMN